MRMPVHYATFFLIGNGWQAQPNLNWSFLTFENSVGYQKLRSASSISRLLFKRLSVQAITVWYQSSCNW
jgi:hypothetical protein